jgi:hypothetical protein
MKYYLVIKDGQVITATTNEKAAWKFAEEHLAEVYSVEQSSMVRETLGDEEHTHKMLS